MRKRPSTGWAPAQEQRRPCCGKGPSPALSSQGQGVFQLPEAARLAPSRAGFAGLAPGPAGCAGPGPPFPPSRAPSPRLCEPSTAGGSQALARDSAHSWAVLLSRLPAGIIKYLFNSLSSDCVSRKERRALVFFLPN